jgi:hypothetical protein
VRQRLILSKGGRLWPPRHAAITAIKNAVSHIGKIRNQCYKLRAAGIDAPDGWRKTDCRLGHVTSGLRRDRIFCLHPSQPIEKSRFEKINASKRKQIY